MFEREYVQAHSDKLQADCVLSAIMAVVATLFLFDVARGRATASSRSGGGGAERSST